VQVKRPVINLNSTHSRQRKWFKELDLWVPTLTEMLASSLVLKAPQISSGFPSAWPGSREGSGVIVQKISTNKSIKSSINSTKFKHMVQSSEGK